LGIELAEQIFGRPPLLETTLRKVFAFASSPAPTPRFGTARCAEKRMEQALLQTLLMLAAARDGEDQVIR
jgi:hypothetical protein